MNMGLNVFSGEVSFITQAVSPILQLAVSLDYAIFLLHTFEKRRQETNDAHVAMQQAMKAAFPAVAASAATTLFGFMALIFMEFRIGADLGINLAKGIILSFLTVMLFLPALTLCSYKLLDKTRHKKLIPDFNGIGKFLLKIRIPALFLVLLLVVPCFLAQSNTNFSYGTGTPDISSKLGMDTTKIEVLFGKSTAIVIFVPKGETSNEIALCNDLEAMEHVTSIISFTSLVGRSIPTEYLDKNITESFYSDNYARIIVNTDTTEEGDEAFDVVRGVRQKTGEYYETSYSCGESANLYDMKNVVQKDNTVTNLIAILAIAITIIIAFKSAFLPAILLLVIESAIWVNLSVPYFIGDSLVYLGYLVINTVQLGATIDYAILMTESYMKYRKEMPKKEAMIKTLHENFMSILTSALILTGAGFALYWTSTEMMITVLGLLLGRGTALSFTMVVTVLPALFLLFDKVVNKTTLRSEFY
jgi:predicted RND superfamily exporter protein